MGTESLLNLAIFIAATTATATGGAIFRPGVWYAELRKPSWTPPNWLFGPVWLVLYGMIAVSGWLITEAFGWRFAVAPLAVYALQLALNFLWSAVFFGLRRIGLALVEICGLWLSVAACIALFRPIDPVAAWLLVPYLFWVSYAAALNAAIWALNRPRPGPAAAG